MYYTDDDECTAAAGVMGITSCHLYPRCGCGGVSSQPSEVETYTHSQESSTFQNRPSNWHVLTFRKIETLSKGFYRIWIDDTQFAENERYFPCKIEGNKLMFHKSTIKTNLGEYFTLR